MSQQIVSPELDKLAAAVRDFITRGLQGEASAAVACTTALITASVDVLIAHHPNGVGIGADLLAAFEAGKGQPC